MSSTARTAFFATTSLVVGILAGSVSTAPAAIAAPSSCDSLEVIAHRGSQSSGVDQNTIRAFNAAHREGYSIEADVWVDSEQVLWLFHDRNTLRATGTPGFIDEMTTAQVERLRYSKADSPLLRLDDAMTNFRAHPTTRVYLEPKVARLAGVVADAVFDRGLRRSVWITDHTDEARAARPTVQVAAKVDGPLRERPRIYVRNDIGVVAAPSGKLVPATVARYQRRGVEVQGRNIGNTGAWRRAIQAGADAQLTDRPAALTRFCPAALKIPRIAARKSGRTGPRTVTIRGKFFYDVRNVRVAGREIDYSVVSPRRITARFARTKDKQVEVYVRNPNGAVERTVRLKRR